MRILSRTFRVAGAAALLMSLLAMMVAPVSAQQAVPDGPAEDQPFQTTSQSFRTGVNTIYYPWVANNDNFGLGDADTSISVQNLEDRDAQIYIYVGDGGGGFSLAASAFLSRYASKTFTAEQLDIAEGEGAPVAVAAFHRLASTISLEDFIESEVMLNRPVNVGGLDPEVTVCVANQVITEIEIDDDSGEETSVTFAVPAPFLAAVTFTFEGVTYEANEDLVPWENEDDLQDILDSVNVDGGQLINPFGGLNADGDCLDQNVDGSLFDSVAIGGVAKAAVGGENLPYTSSADTAVSGYNALSGFEIFRFDEWYLPIVQTNCGPGGCWDSVLRVANVGAINNAVTVRFFPHDDAAGSLDTGFQIQDLVDGGETWTINLSDHVPEGWVGSAHIYSDGAVFAMVDRFKVGYDMWITNTGSSAGFENRAQIEGDAGDYVLFAPHVLLDYFGWNTGINVANLVNEDNNVSIQYFNLLGNATQGLNRRIAPHGMTYFYDPSQAPQDNNSQDVAVDANAGIVGSALIWSDFPIAAVVDATKYPESDPSGGVDLFQATSYSATQNVFTFQAVPLAQKGNPADGMGATSGINIMNPNAEAATVNVYWVNQSGFLADNFGISSVSIPGFANGFVYSLTQENLPNGFYGAAQVIASVPVVAVSANVDYQVDGDGSAMFNAYNPCGFFRTIQGDPGTDDDPNPDNLVCSFGDPFTPGGQSMTKTFTDTAGNPIAGVGFSIVGQNPAFPFQRDGFSGTDGSTTFTNVPVGEYELIVTSTPDDFLLPERDLDDPELFTVNEGDDVSLTNVLEFAQGFTKFVCIDLVQLEDDDGELVFDDDGEPVMVCSENTLSGVDVIVYDVIGEDFIGLEVVGDVVFEGQTDVDGSVSASLPVGTYLLCLYDEDGEAVTPNGESVTVGLAAEFDISSCIVGDDSDVFEVEAGEFTEVFNEVEIVGQIDIFVGGPVLVPAFATLDQASELNAIAGVEVCIEDIPLQGDLECKFSDENGLVQFAVESLEEEMQGEVGAQVDPGLNDLYHIYLFSDDYDFECATGGEQTALVNNNEKDCEESVGSDSVEAQDHTQDSERRAGRFRITYDLGADVAQDGWLDDVSDDGSLRGSFDLTIEMMVREQ